MRSCSSSSSTGVPFPPSFRSKLRQQQQQQQEKEEPSVDNLSSVDGPSSAVSSNSTRFVLDPFAASPSNSLINRSKHMKTYTAGEDGSRLAAAAKELGLEQSRQPRRQVRQPRQRSRSRHPYPRRWNDPASIFHLLLETGTEDARMRAICSAHDDTAEQLTVTQDHLPYYFLGQQLGQQDERTADQDTTQDAHTEVGMGSDLPAAVLGIIKGMVGPAILYLPHGFASAGFAIALPILFFTTMLFLYSSTCLLQAWQTQDEKASDINISDDNEMSAAESSGLLDSEHNNSNYIAASQSQRRAVRLSYPELAYRALGTTGESLVKTGIAFMQSGVCLTYLIFVPQNLHASFVHLFHWKASSPSLWLMAMVAIQLPLSWIRDIRKLTPTNLAANCCILYGLTVCLYYAVATTLSGPPHTSRWTNLWDHVSSLTPFAEDWILFIGTSVLLFEGSITLLVPLQESVDSDEARVAFPVVYKRVILGIIGFYAFFGLTCWIAFGGAVHTVLTTSLPDTNLSTTVQLAYSVAVILTFPLQNFPALEITTRTIQARSLYVSSTCHNCNGGNKTCWSSRSFLSSCLVFGLSLVAVFTMDSLDKVVSLMGSLLGCPIAFVFPPLIHSRLATNLTPTRLWCNRIVAALGVGAMMMASTTTLLTWK